MYKNIADQRFYVYAWDGANSVAKTGDAGNITAQISKDAGAAAATNDANPTELDATDHPGVYYFNALQAETNADEIVVTPVSSTDNIIFRPLFISTTLVKYLIRGLINKRVWTEQGGQLEMFDDSDVSLGTIAAQVSSDGTYTTAKRAVI